MIPQRLYWYDFVCPFCYVGPHQNATLRGNGLKIVELPFQAYPDVPLEGVPAGRQRGGQTYSMLGREAEESGLKLNWPQRLPNTPHGIGCGAVDTPRSFDQFRPVPQRAF